MGLGKALRKKHPPTCPGSPLGVQIAKGSEVCECLVRGNHLFPNPPPKRVKLGASLFQRNARLEPPRRLQPARSAALQILLHICLASKQLPCRKRQRYLHFHVGADSGETLARYTDDCEWNSLDLQSFADSVPRAPVRS